MVWSALAAAAASYGLSKLDNADSANDNFASAQAFNREEAEKNRAFQLQSFQNRHQWEVEDLKKAGLNPILSAGGQPPILSGSSAQSAQPDFGAADRKTRRMELVANSAKTASEIMLNKSLANKANAEASAVSVRESGNFPFTNIPLSKIKSTAGNMFNSAKDFIKRGKPWNPQFRTR